MGTKLGEGRSRYLRWYRAVGGYKAVMSSISIRVDWQTEVCAAAHIPESTARNQKGDYTATRPMWGVAATQYSRPWVEAPYHPMLELRDILLDEPEPSQGFPFMLILAEAYTGVVRTVRIVGLGREFSLMLRKAIYNLKSESFAVERYRRS